MTIFIQLSDPHLFSENESQLFGVETNKNFYKVIDTLKQDEARTSDFFLLTGDLSQDESEKSYQRIVEALTYFNIPVYWIPGNHDSIEIMSHVFGRSPLFHRERQLQTGVANFIFLNTKLEGSDEGFLSDRELQELENSLKKLDQQQKQMIIVMHHHTIKTDTPLIDQYILRNRDSFWKIVERFPRAKLVICGHVHGDYHLQQGHTSIETAPATCMQWVKGTTTLKVEPKIGYKRYHMTQDSYVAETIMWDA